jgi:hypothetical protein
VAEGVGELAVAVAMALVREGAEDGGAGGEGAGEPGVYVGDGEVEQGGGAADGLRAEDADLGELVGEVEGGAADAQLGMADTVLGRGDARDLDGAEGRLIEGDGVGASLTQR